MRILAWEVRGACRGRAHMGSCKVSRKQLLSSHF